MLRVDDDMGMFSLEQNVGAVMGAVFARHDPFRAFDLEPVPARYTPGYKPFTRQFLRSVGLSTEAYGHNSRGHYRQAFVRRRHGRHSTPNYVGGDSHHYLRHIFIEHAPPFFAYAAKLHGVPMRRLKSREAHSWKVIKAWATDFWKFRMAMYAMEGKQWDDPENL